MALCMCLGMLYYGLWAGAGVAPPASAGNCWYNQHQHWPPASARPPGEKERASEEYFTQRQNPAQLLLTAPPWGCSTVRKHFIHFITFLTHTVEMGKWQCLFGNCWRGQLKYRYRLLSRLLFWARFTFIVRVYCAVTFNFAGIIAKKCCKGKVSICFW